MANNAFKSAVAKRKTEVDDNAIIELAARKGFSESNGASPKPRENAKPARPIRPGSENKTITLRASPEAHDWLVTVAQYKRISLGRMLAKLIDNYEEKSGEDIDLARFKEELRREG